MLVTGAKILGTNMGDCSAMIGDNIIDHSLNTGLKYNEYFDIINSKYSM